MLTMHTAPFSIIDAHSPEEQNEVRTLFRLYQQSVDANLCFQQFEEELAGLPGNYAPPGGCLLIAVRGDESAGCVAARDGGGGACEMKRLFVKPKYRGRGLGAQLIGEILRRAPLMGYERIQLDTLPSMQKAIALYESFGFTDIEANTSHSVAGIRYMQKWL